MYKVNLNTEELLYTERYEELEATSDISLYLKESININDSVIQLNEIAEYWKKINNILVELTKCVEVKDDWSAYNMLDYIDDAGGRIHSFIECVNNILFNEEERK